jgi:hypothetical protein
MFFLLLFFDLALTQCMDPCMGDDSKCAGCGFETGTLGHSVFTQAIFRPFVQYTCVANKCTLNSTLAQQNPTFVSQCHSDSGGPCCIPTNSSFDLGTCDGKTVCKSPLTSGCNPLGKCEYSNVDIYINCCRTDSDCPATRLFLGDNAFVLGPDVFFDIPFTRECGRYKCIAGSCIASTQESCCTTDVDCGVSPVPNLPYQCAEGGANPNAGICTLGLRNPSFCFDDNACGGNGVVNQCAVGTCVGEVPPVLSGICSVAPRFPGITPGCCTSDTGPGAETCETSDVCKLFTGCGDSTSVVQSFPSGSVSYLPSYRCEYVDYTPQGCCSVNQQCAEIQDGCVSSTCNLLTNRCAAVPNAGDLTQVCGEFSANCGQPALPTHWFKVTSPAFGNTSALYVCQAQTVDPVPVSPPLSGFVPPVSQLLPDNACLWSNCAQANRNKVQFNFTFELVDDSQGPLYDGNLIFQFGSNLPALNVTNGLTFFRGVYQRSSPLYINAEGGIRRPFFFSGVSISRLSGIDRYQLEFLPKGSFTLWPGERIEITVEVAVIPLPGLTQISGQASLQGFDFCHPYYLGSSVFVPAFRTCDNVTLLYGERFHTFNYGLGPLTTTTFGSGCASLCGFVVAPSTTTTSPTITLPVPTTGPTGPTPVPVTLPPPPIPPNVVTGLVFIDKNGDSVFNAADGDDRLGNYRVNVHLDSTGSITVATRTDAFGVYQFNRTFLFTAAGLNPAGSNVYIGVLGPNSFVRTPALPPSSNLLISSFVSDSLTSGGSRAPQSFGLSTPTTLPAMSVGFRDPDSACAASRDPIPGNSNFTLAIVAVACDACLRVLQIDPSSSSDSTDSSLSSSELPQDFIVNRGECHKTCAESPGAQFKRVQYKYSLLNNRGSPTAVRPGSVIAQLELAPGTQAICVEPFLLKTSSENIKFLNKKSTRKSSRNARIEMAHGSIDASAEESFDAYYSICFEQGSNQLVNTTLAAQTDRCVRRIRDWSTCVEPVIDINDCETTLPGALDACQSCNLIDEGEDPRFDTTLSAIPTLTREPSTCVSNRRIATFGCGKDSTITAECLASGASRAVVVAEVELKNRDTAKESEHGTLRITLSRDNALLNFCTRIKQAQLSLEAFDQFGQPTPIPAKILNSNAQDADNIRIDVAFTAIPPETSVFIRMMSLHCLDAAAIVDYKLTADLITEKCEERNLCRGVAKFQNQTITEMPVRACFDPLLFSSFVDFEDERAQSFRKSQVVETESNSGVLWWILVVILGLAVLGVLLYLALRRRGTRRRY